MEKVEKRTPEMGRPRELDIIKHDLLPRHLNSCKETKKEYMREYMKQYRNSKERQMYEKEYYQKNKETCKERSKKAYNLKAGNIIII